MSLRRHTCLHVSIACGDQLAAKVFKPSNQLGQHLVHSRPTCAGLGEWNAAAFLLGALVERRTYALPMAGMQASELDDLAQCAKVELGDSVFERDHEAGRSASDKEVMDRLRPVITRLLAPPAAPTS